MTSLKPSSVGLARGALSRRADSAAELGVLAERRAIRLANEALP